MLDYKPLFRGCVTAATLMLYGCPTTPDTKVKVYDPAENYQPPSKPDPVLERMTIEVQQEIDRRKYGPR
jgi:hypothetical protein